MVLFPQPTRGVPRPEHMIVCGDDALAERPAAELTTVYRERVTLVVPPAPRAGPAGRAPQVATLLGRLQAAMNRTDADLAAPQVIETPVLDEAALAEAGAR